MNAAFCCCTLMAFAVILHRTATNAPLPRRPVFADLAACLTAAWIFALSLCLSARPLFALALGILFSVVIWAVNAAKMRALRGEPLVITDVALAWQVVRFPGLYLPFLPCARLLFGGMAGAVILVFVWRAAPAQQESGVWWVAAAAPLAVCFFLRTRPGNALARYLLAAFPLKFDPGSDARRYGPLGAALLHAVWCLNPRKHPDMAALRPAIRRADGKPDQDSLPHIFLVQAESFCDPRLYSSAVPRDLLKNWDALCEDGQSGRLYSSAYGAYTMRTEYAVLTGQSAASLGVDAFHPYLGAARSPRWSIARHLRSLGYRTVCLHPFHREFFCRHKAIPNLGFEDFVTLENFPHKETWGPYVSDKSVALSMLDLVREDSQPVFCFAITMESHGPWLQGRLREEFAAAAPDPDRGTTDMADAPAIPGLDAPTCRYLAHLRHADAMLGMLRDGLRQKNRPAVLGWYGDHLPNLPGLVPQGQTGIPYLVWKTGTSGNRAARADITPEELGGYILSTASLR